MVNQAALVIIGISVGLALGLFLAFLAFFAIKRCYNHAYRNERSQTPTTFRSNTSSSSITIRVLDNHATTTSSQLSWWTKHPVASASGIPRYSYKDIQKGTQNFTTTLGQGSFGPVYKAKMATGQVGAVKVLASDSKQGEKEFQTEVFLLARLHHRNLVNLIGYCVDKGQHMLVYEFMSNGSLADLLYGEGKRHLSWEERLQIALDISHGIEYLHEGAVPPVIHRDLKSANILLDHSMRAKVADFGLSKEEVFDGRNSGLKGTYGYIDPVYISTNKFTMKSDIYSFGVIIYELITAIHPHQNLMEYVNLASMSSDGVDEILDKQLVGECDIEEVRRLANIANKCLHKIPRKRLSTGEVSQAILRIKQRRIVKDETMSLSGGDLSRMVSRIENQQVELSKMASIKERE